MSTPEEVIQQQVEEAINEFLLPLNNRWKFAKEVDQLIYAFDGLGFPKKFKSIGRRLRAVVLALEDRDPSDYKTVAAMLVTQCKQMDTLSFQLNNRGAPQRITECKSN